MRELTRLELVLETVRPALEECARTGPEILGGLVDEDWALRYGRQVRLVSQPSHPAARLKQAGTDAAELLERVRSRRPGMATGPAMEALRQIMVQHFLVDARGQLRPRAEKDGFPSTGRRLESPYDLEARYTRRGHRTWVGYLAHATQTCDEGRVNIITDVATTVPTGDSTALPGIHTRLKRRRPLPTEHLIDSGYTSVVLHDTAARTHRVTMVGPLRTNNSRQRKTDDGFAQENFIIDFDHREVTCPNGQVSGNWNELPAMAPFTVVRFHNRQCGPCPERPKCTSGAARTVNFLPDASTTSRSATAPTSRTRSGSVTTPHAPASRAP
ncbi:hypothetical protein Scel_84100 [Streptomyces cellostaticus]|nr:hypothetical protein Scel_84100 [Streptomyces cellostaticus]